MKKWITTAAVLGVAVCVAALWPEPALVTPDYRRHAAGPTESRSVYWVGHSLLAFRSPHRDGARNVMETVEDLARAGGLAYRGYDQTLWGSPLSLAYRGATHGHDRSEPELAMRRRELLENGSRYDTMVLTDTVPIDGARRYEHTSYYAHRFACDLVRSSPRARVYLYESWVSLQASWDEAGVGSPAAWRWVDRLRDERDGYTEVSREVSAGRIRPPSRWWRLTRWFAEPASCRLSTPVFVVPVASTFVRLASRLEADGLEVDGRPMTLEDFFHNPYTALPEGWPRDDLDEVTARALLRAQPRRFEDEPVDDIHPSPLGTYFAGLVHFATLYRRSPEGLPPLESGLDPENARRLQRLVWDQVVHDERTGVAAE